MLFLISRVLGSRFKTHLGGRLPMVCLILAACTAQLAHADIQLVSLASSWSYQQTTNLDGVNWQLPSYDDSNWSSGNALLYVENNFLVTPKNTLLTIGRNTYYFRKHFTFPVEVTNVYVAVSAYIDDGAVFYLNGQEIQRVRMPASPAPITYTNLATATPPGGDATAADTFVISGASLTNLIKGDNVLSVEVHQNVTNSDDIVFGASVVAKFTNSPPVLFHQPVDVVVMDGRPAALAASIDGNPVPAFQWFKSGVAVPNATNSALIFSAAYPTDAGVYSLAATNIYGALITSNAVLTVLDDTNPPVLLSAYAQKNGTNISLTFSEPVLPSTLTASNNLEIFQAAVPTNRLSILSVVPSGNSAAVLTTAPRIPGVNYTLRVNGIRDISSLSNLIAADTELPLSYQVDLLPVDAQTLWKYYPVGQLPGTNWASPDFDDSSWLSGAPVFQAGTPLPSTTDPLRTILPLNSGSNAFQTYYFRTFFDLPGPVDTNTIRLHDLVDDGAIFYLNGSEVFSIGMPPVRPAVYSTAASRSISTAVYEPPPGFTPWTIAPTNLAAARNFLAVEVHQSTNGLSDVAFSAILEATVTGYYPRPQLSIPSVILEGAGTLAGQGQLTILEPLSSDLVLQLSSSSTGDIGVPSSVKIPAGATNAAFDLVIGDNFLVDGPRTVSLMVTGTNVVPNTAAAQVLDNETNLISFVISPTVSETNGTILGEVHFSQASINPISVALTSSDPTALVLPPSVMMPAGATSSVFQASVLDDLLLDGPRFVTLAASVPSWTTASTTVQVNDDERATIALQLPVSVVEGNGTLTNAGKVTLGGIAVSNVTVAFQSSDQNSLIPPTNVTILAGQSNVFFNLGVGDNLIVDGDRFVGIAASAPGFTSVSNVVKVVDNDPHHIRFGSVLPLTDTNSVFGIQLTAQNADGSVQTNFNGRLSMIAEGLEGVLPVEPTNSGNFVRGQLFLNCRVTMPGHAVRLRALEYPGQSDPFNVIPPPFFAIAQPVADIVWHAASQTLLASVPASASNYSNCIVAIDPATGLVTNSYPVAYNPSQMEISPDGNYLYVAISNRTILQRFDLNTRTAGLKVLLGTSATTFRFAYDFCIPPGFSNSVVVAARDQDTIGNTSLAGIWRYDNGAAVSLPSFTGSGGWRTESLNTGRDVILSPPLSRGDAETGTILVSTTNSLGRDMNFRDGQLFDDQGNFYTSTDLRLLGTFPNVIERLNNNALPAVNSMLRRVFYLAGYFNFGQSIYKLKVYDRDLLQPLLELPVPATPGTPTRFLQWNTNGLAYVTSNNQLWFVQPEAVQPTNPPAELGLSYSSLPPTAVVGTDYTFSLSLSNAGPGTASLVRVTNALPVNATLVQISPSTGIVVPTNSAFTWNVAALPAGSDVTLQVTLRFNTGGWQTNTTWALGFEADPVPANSSLTLPIFVQLPTTVPGAFAVNCSSEDLMYDPVRDRLLLSVGSGIVSNQTNGLAVFNPYNGVTESFTALGKKPSKLARSYDGTSLYVSLPDDALVRRLNLPTLSQNLEFGLGGEYIYGVWYPFYANDFASVPGDSDSLVAFRVRRAGPMADEFGEGLALFQNGVMRTNVTETGGSWKVEFDNDTGTLFGFNLGDLRRCSFDSNGVSFIEQYPAFASYSAGNDIEYGAGHLFTTAGKMVDYQPFRLAWVFSGAENATLVEPDAVSRRVFYLVQTNGWQIRAYDVQNRLLLGNIPVPNVLGTPSTLIRWGTNGLAFRTSSNQLYVVRSPLISSNAATDIALKLNGPGTPISLGSNAVFTLTITNQGSVLATGIQVTNTFSSAMNLVSAVSSAGTWMTNYGVLIWTLPALGVGEQATLSYTITPGQTGLFTAIVIASEDTPDLQPGNNKAMRSVLVGTPPTLDNAIALFLPVNGMVWSPSVGRLLLTSSTNTPNWGGALLSVDPTTLAVQFESSLGADAGRLAISRDDLLTWRGWTMV
ncbi:conserved repeat domain protein [Pedosphaera parvula Ellin514]|uniref:Conserved repeat domain protein n=1 Tax=Pedosphaera parvula (strain Ellin514) TaxID=320771 RepID=B9XL95_PEDPL|nr:conserved repeat domain protein [Pedosphaera parvula Ellin514]